MSAITSDVVIAGGGLAGLGLARQLITKRPDLDILILERNRFPVDGTTAKVGESTVEIASRYLCDSLDLSEHFRDKHLQKFGLRCFFGSPQTDFSAHDELGVSQRFPLPTYQLERGVLENHLFAYLTQRGVRIDHGVQIQSVDIKRHNHKVIFTDSKQQVRQCKSRWLVDCAGRFSLIKRQLQLEKPSDHKGNAIWFRIDKTIKIDDWSSDKPWRQRMQLEGKRWLSTNHLMGPGYWVWIIPLASGATSIGIVMDDQAWHEAGIKNFDETLDWLFRHHPQCAEAIAGSQLLDFVALQDYSYDCKKLFSSDGWGVSGEAGVFADPFYSPGSDFIALGNEILSHLITADSQGASIDFDTRVMEFFFTSFFANTLSLYTGQYGGFGDRVMMSAKLVWDYCFYWGILALIYYKGAVTNIPLLRSVNTYLLEAIELNTNMQASFRTRAQQRRVMSAQGTFVDQFQIPVLHQLIEQLSDESLTLTHALPNSIQILRELAPIFSNILDDNAHRQISASEYQLLGSFRNSVFP